MSIVRSASTDICMRQYWYCLIQRALVLMFGHNKNMPKSDNSKIPKIHRDEVKKDKILQKKKMEMISTIDNVIVAIRSNPDI